MDAVAEFDADCVKSSENSWGSFQIFQVVWNGDSSVDVSASLNLKGSLCGLCGNYNDKQDDEYTTKQGFIETDVHKFGNSWKVSEAAPFAGIIRCFGLEILTTTNRQDLKD